VLFVLQCLFTYWQQRQYARAVVQHAVSAKAQTDGCVAITEALNLGTEVRASWHIRRWQRGRDRCDRLLSVLIEFTQHPLLESTEKAALRGLLADLQVVVQVFEEAPVVGALPLSMRATLDSLQQHLSQIAARLRYHAALTESR
jgi:hypothetical protein